MKIKGTLLTAAILILLMSNSDFAYVENPGNGVIDLSELFDYTNLNLPERAEYRYNDINPLTDIGATLGRVLFYDKKLSVNSTTSCASCHQQENAFGDFRTVSEGFNGESTKRHAMRLINTDLHADHFKFWDERVSRLENLATLPIQDTIEMGFSGINGFPGIDSLIQRMENIDYYPTLFSEVFGDEEITEKRMGFAIAQFIRSIVTFDTPFDEGFNSEGQEISDFPNFTDQENYGKQLFFTFPRDNRNLPNEDKGAGCGLCHKAPSLDIIHISDNNGVISVAGDPTAIDLSIQRAPSIKNLVKPDGSSNGPFMHDGSLETLADVVDHYNFIPFDSRNTLQDGLLFPEPNGNVDLGLTDEDQEAIIAFLKTLSGPDVYTNEKWSNPFDVNGDLQVINSNNCDNPLVTELDISICEGENFEGRTVGGVYVETFQLENGCDSIRRLTLHIIADTRTQEVISICPGEDHRGYTESGVYTETFSGSGGCDSIYMLFLDVLDDGSEDCAPVCPSIVDDISISICEGQTYEGYSQSGVYSDSFQLSNGCDSIRNLNLIVLPVPTKFEEVAICEGDEYNGLTVAGEYTANISASSGCDTLYTLTLMIKDEDDAECLESSTEDFQNLNLQLAPNPVLSFLSISNIDEGEYTILIIDTKGQMIKTSKLHIAKNATLAVDDIANGMYVLKLVSKDSGKSYVGKFVKI